MVSDTLRKMDDLSSRSTKVWCVCVCLAYLFQVNVVCLCDSGSSRNGCHNHEPVGEVPDESDHHRFGHRLPQLEGAVSGHHDLSASSRQSGEHPGVSERVNVIKIKDSFIITVTCRNYADDPDISNSSEVVTYLQQLSKLSLNTIQEFVKINQHFQFVDKEANLRNLVFKVRTDAIPFGRNNSVMIY